MVLLFNYSHHIITAIKSRTLQILRNMLKKFPQKKINFNLESTKFSTYLAHKSVLRLINRAILSKCMSLKYFYHRKKISRHLITIKFVLGFICLNVCTKTKLSYYLLEDKLHFYNHLKSYFDVYFNCNAKCKNYNYLKIP